MLRCRNKREKVEKCGRVPLSPLLTLKINVLANKYPNKYPKTNFFGYFSYIRVPIMKPEAPARLPALV